MACFFQNATQEDLLFIDDLFKQSKQKPDLDIGYPRCDNICEYLTELALFENDFSNCTFVITNNE